MEDSNKQPDPPPSDAPQGGGNPAQSLTLKDYLETATDASRRTRFITIVMIVASVLVMVSVLNSSDYGWISLRLKALGDSTSEYTLMRFPLLCKCDEQVKDDKNLVAFCKELGEKDEDAKNSFLRFDRIAALVAAEELLLKTLEAELANLRESRRRTAPNEQRGTAGEVSDAEVSQKEREVSDKRRELEARSAEGRQACAEVKESLSKVNEAMQRSAVETKYTMRAPFFGVAFDVNDAGLLGGASLLITLVLLRLSLRSQIVSLRVGFKAARAAGQERWFYEVLAGRQVFVFPYLEDRQQKAGEARGWTEIWWDKSAARRDLESFRGWVIRRLEAMRRWLLKFLNIEAEVLEAEREAGIEEGAEPGDTGATGAEAGQKKKADFWRANRSAPLRVIPKLLCLLPFGIYAFQFGFDVMSLDYGYYVSKFRTVMLLVVDLLLLLNILGFGLWCMAKWNELDKLWDIFKNRIDWKK